MSMIPKQGYDLGKRDMKDKGRNLSQPRVIEILARNS
jgi:hypothetical protein